MEDQHTITRNESIAESNQTKHYTLLTIAIIIGFIGVMLRFVTDGFLIDLVSNIIWIIGIIIALVAVGRILQTRL